MTPRASRRLAVALLALVAVATFALVWAAGLILDLFLLGTAIVVGGCIYVVCRFLPPVESAFTKAMRETAKASGIHPAGSGRVTDSAEAAWLDNPVVLREPNPERVTSEPMHALLHGLTYEVSRSRETADRQLAKAAREFNENVISR